MVSAPDDIVFVLEDVLGAYQEAQPEFADRQPNRSNNFCGGGNALPETTGI